MRWPKRLTVHGGQGSFDIFPHFVGVKCFGRRPLRKSHNVTRRQGRQQAGDEQAGGEQVLNEVSGGYSKHAGWKTSQQQ